MFLLVLLLAPSGVAQAAGLVITDDREYGPNTALPVTGDLVIKNGAEVSFGPGSSIYFNGPERTLRVEAGGRLDMESTRIIGDNPVRVIVEGRLQAVDGSVRARSVHVPLSGSRLLTDGTDVVVDDAVFIGAGARWELSGGRLAASNSTILIDGEFLAADDAVIRADDAGLRVTATGFLRLRDTFLLSNSTGVECIGDSEIRIEGSTVDADHDALSVTDGCYARVVASGIQSREGTGLRARGSRVDAFVTDIVATEGPAVDLSAGSVGWLNQSRVASLNASALRLTGSRGGAVGTDFTSANAGAASCDASHWIGRGGSYGSAGAAFHAVACTGSLADAELISQDSSALRWLNGATSGAFTIRNVTLPESASPALELRGPGRVEDVGLPAAAEGIRWSSVGPTGAETAGAVLVDITGGNSATCAVCLSGGRFDIQGFVHTGTGVPMRSDDARLDLRDAKFSGSTPAWFNRSTVRLVDSDVTPAQVAVDASTVESIVNLRARVLFKNQAPVSGAQVEVRETNGGAVLWSETTGSDGRTGAHEVLAFTKDAAGTNSPASFAARATFGSLTLDGSLPRSRQPPALVLVDNQAPAALQGLRLTSGANTGNLDVAWNASSDNLPSPVRYSVQLGLQTGFTKVVVGQALQNFTTQDLGTTTGLSRSIALPGQGSFLVKVRPLDASGNNGTEQSLPVVWDTAPPDLNYTVTPATASTEWSNVPIVVRPRVSDLASKLLVNTRTVDGVAVSGNEQFNISQSGSHEVRLTAEDAAGNRAEATFTVRIDVTAPAPPSLATSDKLVHRQPGAARLSIVGEASDALSGMREVRLVRVLDETAPQLVNVFRAPYPTDVEVRIEEGRNAFLLIAVDQAGNQGASLPLVFLVDTVPPRYLGTSNQSGGPRLYRFDDGSEIVRVEAYLNGALWETRTGGDGIAIDPQALEPGVHTLRVVAVDEVGNTMEVEEEIDVPGGGKSPGPPLGLLLGALALLVGLRRARDK